MSSGLIEHVDIVKERSGAEPIRESPRERGLPSTRALVLAMRPKQWVKNTLLLIGILFTLDQGHTLEQWLRVFGAFTVFCALSSAIYLINDICDVQQDRVHPRKRFRPIAAGLVSIPAARILAVLLGTAGLAGALLLGRNCRNFAAVAIGYVILTVAYSLKLKHVVLIDVMALAGCYVLRIIAGAVVIDVRVSGWLLLCATFGALLVGLAKRRNELMTLNNAGNHRAILDEYTGPLLDQLIGVITACTLVAYVQYTFFSPTAQKHSLIYLTIPCVLYGVFRFLYLIHRHGKGGDPSSELLEDRNMLACAVAWLVTCAMVMLIG
jgi:4-hydroxybenzoate polyprenyltransferase